MGIQPPDREAAAGQQADIVEAEEEESLGCDSPREQQDQKGVPGAEGATSEISILLPS